MTTRQKILEVAAAEIGSPGKARIQEYHRSAIGPSWSGRGELEWCGLFCLWALHQAGVAPDVLWRLTGGFCEEHHLPKTREPRPGDVAYFAKPYHHHALVETVGNGIVTTIDGNQTGDTVSRRTRALTAATHYYAISPLLDEETQPGPTRFPTLRLSSTGKAVRHLQSSLNGAGARLSVDGNFGPVTSLAVQSFQRRAGLDADGVVGPKTWAALEKPHGTG